MNQGQQQARTPQEVLQSFVRRIQMEAELANQKGRDTPEGMAHLQRARQISQHLQEFRARQMAAANHAQQAQGGPDAQARMARGGGAAPGRAMGPAAAGGPKGQMSPMAQQAPASQMSPMGQQTPMGPSGSGIGQMPMGQGRMNQMGMNQMGMNQMGQMNQMNQMNPMGQMGQMGQMNQMNQMGQLNQMGQGEQGRANMGRDVTVNMTSANGFQQRAMQLEELRKSYNQHTLKIEQLERAAQTLSNQAEIDRVQQQITFLRHRRDQIRARESTLVRELRTFINSRQSQGQGQGQGQSPAGTPQGPAMSPAGPQPMPQQPQSQLPASQQQQQQQQQQAAQMQSQMLRGVPRNAQGQPMSNQQLEATRAAQMRLLQQQQQQQQRQQQAQAQAQAHAQAQAQQTQGAPPPRPGAGAVPAQTGPPAAQTQRPPSGMAAPPRAGTPQANPAMISSQPRPSLAQVMPIPSHLNVPSPQPTTIRAGCPTLTNGDATDALALNSPSLTRAPPLDLTGERLLSKRKLSDLVTGVMGSDNKPLIDGDVEELLLDLADEFVTSVTSFASKLAKHRKSDVLEAKDIHMHLERNWNMHIAGYSSDEVRSIRRFMPTTSYQQKLQNIATTRNMKK